MLEEVAGRFDPGLLDARTADRVLDDVVAIKNVAATLKADLLAHAANRGA